MYKGFADISALSSGVSDLKKVLSNVKTRGILGEIQLGAILDEILAPEQFDTNIATIPNSSAVVEFAVKLPHDDEGFIYLPIDSKFPLDAYNDLLNAYDTGRQRKLFKPFFKNARSANKAIRKRYSHKIR